MLDFPFLIVVVASTLTDAAVAAWTLFSGRQRDDSTGPLSIDLRRLILAILRTGSFFAIKLPIFWKLGVHSFGFVHLIYFDLVVLIPAIGLVLLALSGSGRRRPTLAVKMVSAGSLILIPIGVYATWIEPYNLKLETAKLVLPASREGSKPVKIGILTDLQTGGVGVHEHRAIDLLMAQKPDVILLPGDVFQGSEAEFEATKAGLKNLLSKLQAPGGVYLVLGDTDGPGDHLRAILPETSIRLLVDEIARVSVNGRNLTIGGVQLAYKSDPSEALVRRLETDDGDGDIRIIVAHRPDVALGLRPGSRVDVVVAGHTHGGQIVVPGYGPPVTLSSVPREVAAGGLHRIGGNPIYVSRGVGSERGQAPRIRFLCPPEVSILELGGTDLSVSSPSELPRAEGAR
jgi:predicted MPP superfamily phosphohydrolase